MAFIFISDVGLLVTIFLLFLFGKSCIEDNVVLISSRYFVVLAWI